MENQQQKIKGYRDLSKVETDLINEIKTTEVASIEVAKLVEDTIFWFEQRIETLNDIADCEENVVLASTNGKESKLDDEQSRVFKAGIKTAISIIGKFPLSLDRSTKQFNVDDLEA